MIRSVVFHFYKHFSPLTLSVTLITGFLFWQSGQLSSIAPFFWTKIIINLLAGLLFWLFRRQHLYFYYNLGYSAERLFTLTLVLDMSIWCLLTLIILLLL